jgi:hypothetical protein
MVARLSSDALREQGLTATQRLERATAAKSWLASLAVPAQTRSALTRALDATAGDRDAIIAAVGDLVRLAAPWLDEPSVAELRAVGAGPFVSSR